jgi:hypothetical protein
VSHFVPFTSVSPPKLTSHFLPGFQQGCLHLQQRWFSRHSPTCDWKPRPRWCCDSEARGRLEGAFPLRFPPLTFPANSNLLQLLSYYIANPTGLTMTFPFGPLVPGIVDNVSGGTVS